MNIQHVKQEKRSSIKRFSRGKSDFIEYSILLIDNILLTKGDLSFIQKEMNNNTLPCELRSIAWRLFLKILPSHDMKSWIELTKSNRDKYFLMKNEKVEYITTIHNMIYKDKKINNEDDTKERFLLSKEYIFYKEAYDFIEDMKEVYDLFKLDLIKETVIYVYVTYRKSTEDFKFSSAPFLSILTLIVYSLFSSISSQLKSEFSEKDFVDKALVKGEVLEIGEIMRYLTMERYFESDCYVIFKSLLEEHDWKKTILSINTECLVRDSVYKSINNNKSIENTDDLTLIETLIMIINVKSPLLIHHFQENQFDLNMIFKYWYSTFFSSSFSLNDSMLLLDVVLSNEEQIKNEEADLCFLRPNLKLHFFLFVFASLFCYFEKEVLQIKDFQKFNDFFLIMHEKSIDFKEIIKDALSIREACSLVYMK